MDLLAILSLLCAGFAGGAANAIAGGATLITFPVMLAIGLPPVIANASNSVAVTPGHLMAALADREKLPLFDARMRTALVAALLGGIAGAVLLLNTTERYFTMLVPALIGSATAIYAFARSIQSLIQRWFGATSAEDSGRLRGVLLVAVSVYGGYFGAGLGIMLLAVLRVTGDDDGRAPNAFKNLLATAVSMATVTIFAVQGLVSWPHTLVMLAAAVTGGFLGGKLVRILRPEPVRAVVITAGIVMTIVYVWRYWLAEP